MSLPIPKTPRWARPAVWTGAAAVLAALLAWWSLGGDGADRSRVYKIGYGNDVPFHFKGTNGEPTGLAVDLVSEAARREKIKLEWVTGKSAEFHDGRMDLWVLITIRPELLHRIHITTPYLQTETCFIVREGSRFQEAEDLESARITFLDYATHRKSLSALLPGMNPLPAASSRAALESVANGQADAAYLDEYAAMPALLGGGFLSPLRILPSHAPKGLLGLASSFESARAADAIRAGMESMVLDGGMSRIVERWGFFPNMTSDMIEGLLTEQRKVRALTQAIFLLCASLGASFWLLGRLRRQAGRLRRSEELLTESRSRLQLAMDLARLVPWEYDLEADQLTFEDSLYRIAGAPAAPSGTVRMRMAEYLTKFVPAEDHRRVAGEISRVEPAGSSTPEHLEHRFLRADGTVGSVVVRHAVVKNSAGRPVKTYGVHQDVTGVREAEATKRSLEARSQQARKLESLGRLAGGIAHDFNNILAAMMAHAEMAQNHEMDLAERNERLAQVLVAGGRAAELVNQILTFSRPQKEGLRPAQIGPVVAEAVNLLRATLSPAIRVRTEIQEALPDVKADPTQIHQVMLNLCTNASHAMRGLGGELVVRVERAVFLDSDPRPHAGLAPGEYVQLTVSDNGCGMTEATLERIFEPFFTTKGPAEGTGLGLSVVHGIVRAHDGVITVESRLGAGTTFRVYLRVLTKTN